MVKTVYANGIKFELEEGYELYDVWFLMARMWELAILEGHYHIVRLYFNEDTALIDQEPTYGLCDTLHALGDSNIITFVETQTCLAEIRKFTPNSLAYYWDTWTVEGKKKRIDYCQSMARSLIPKVKPANELCDTVKES